MNCVRRQTIIAAVVSVVSPIAIAQTDNAVPSCSECHQTVAGDQTIDGLVKASVHGTFECTSCHSEISVDIEAKPNPHGGDVAPVACGDCHEDEAEEYVKHGQLIVGSDKDLPTCSICHGSHAIFAAKDHRSKVHPSNLAATCESCHADTDVIKNHHILKYEPIKLYDSSVHGQATERGLSVAATCNDCHSADNEEGKRTAHRILSPADPESPVFHFNIPDTCGRCHEGIAIDYWEGIHGQLVKRGEVDAPICTRCHREHGIVATSDLRSPVSAARLAEATCAPCHESEVLNERYGIPAGRLRSYVDSYHGLKRKAGNVYVANCASCHGEHRILPHTDQRSSIHPSNLQRTCGRCHPGISETLAQTAVHQTATGIRTGWPRFFAVFYLWLIAFTIGSMLLHNLGHWVRQLRVVGKAKYVVRMTASETAQHWVLMISFIVLVLSGFALRFSESWWVEWLFGWGGGEGFVIRGTIHRFSAVIFMVWSGWHVFYLFTKRGRRWIRDMIWTLSDFRHIKDNALYFIGRRERGPSFGRFTYMEKCEYWALIWGAIIMTVTGLLLWFDNYFIQQFHLPKGVLDVALVVHYYEAWLATLAILVWHIYGTVFSPTVYPMNPSWWSGRMPDTMYQHEHPSGPKLKVFDRLTDDELEEPRKRPTSQQDATPPTEHPMSDESDSAPDADD